MTTLLITPTLNSTNQFATSFALHLLKADRSSKKQLFALVSSKDGTKISKSLEPYLEGGQLNILFGSTNSQKIVKKVVEVNEIRAVFVIIDEKSNIDDVESNKGLKSQSFASKTRSFLSSLCSLLDCLRQTNAIPSLVVLFHSFGTVKEEFILPHLDICLPLHPIVQCKTEKSARFSSLHALCHAFAVSYKMNIQIGLVMETTELICNPNVFLEFECLSGLKSEEKSEINFFELGRIDGDEEIFNFTRLLLFSNVSLDEQQKQQAIQSFSSLQNDFFNENTKCVWSSEEEVNDDKIEKEILENWPSHLIIFFRKEKEEEKLREECGPANLKKNICSNLFSPWLLKQVCSEFGLNFVEFPQQKSFEEMKMNMEEVKNRKEIVDFFEKKLENLIMKMDG